MKQSKFNFELTPTNPSAELGFEVWINEQCAFDCEHVIESLNITGDLPDDNIEKEHTLKLVLKHKQSHHTTISESGEILDDACLKISELKFDDIPVGTNMLQTAVYCHNFNSTSEQTRHKFFGTMGCNGTVELKFSTPIYIWFLEHM
jgi:hypothetical protein